MSQTAFALVGIKMAVLRLFGRRRFDQRHWAKHPGWQGLQVLHVLWDKEHAIASTQESVVRQRLPCQRIDCRVTDDNAQFI